MAINLQKGQRISLEKSNGSKLQNICVGINWGAIVYFGNLKSKDQAVRHSGDDLTGDMGGDDGLDNEVITLDFGSLNPVVKHVAFVLNSFRGHDFGTIPFASIRIYEGTPKRVNEIFAKYDIANDVSFKGHVSMVMGVFYNKNGEWKFNAVGEPTKDRKLEETVNTVMRNYL